MGYVYSRDYSKESRNDGREAGRSGVVWFVAYTDVDGRPRRERTTASTKALARRLLSKRENEVETAKLQGMKSVGDLIAPKVVPTLREFYVSSVEKHVGAHCSESTRERYGKILRTHVLPAFGGMRLDTITAGDVQKYSDQRLAEGAAPATVRQELMVLSGIFREAVKAEVVLRNPVKNVRKPHIENKIVRYLSATEEANLLARAPEPLRSAIVFAINTGLREGEQLALTWADVRFDEGVLVIRQTKSGKDRALPMNATVRKLLESMPRHISSPYVFTNTETGTAYERFNATAWRNALKSAGIKDYRWHDNRHTFASRLAQMGESLQTIMQLLGHGSMAMTLRYAHLAPSNLKSAVERLARTAM